MDKSNANEAEEEDKQARKQHTQSAAASPPTSDEQEAVEDDSSDLETVDSAESDVEDGTSMVTGSYVKVKKEDEEATHADAVPEEEEGPDFYDVNVVAWDTPCSALHFAIVCGHEEIVKLLCQEYGADILLPVKFRDSDNKPTAALLTLVLSTKLPIEKAKSMTRTILSLGATCAQADFHWFTAFQRLVDANATELIEILMDLDSTGAKNSVNHIVWTMGQMHWPLQKAAKKGDVRLILTLLEAGAVPQVDFETWLKSAKQSPIKEPQLRGGLERNTKMFQTEVEQPIILAIQSSNPSVALELLKRGADVNTMTSRTNQMIAYNRNGDKGQTVLDLVRQQIKRLRQYEPPAAVQPVLKQGMDDFLARFKEGTWQHLAVRLAVDDANKANEKKLETFETEKARIAARKGLQEKQDALNSAIAMLEELKRQIVEAGGKRFKELYPDFKTNKRHQNQRQQTKESPDFSYEFNFFPSSDVTERKREKYIEL